MRDGGNKGGRNGGKETICKMQPDRGRNRAKGSVTQQRCDQTLSEINNDDAGFDSLNKPFFLLNVNTSSLSC